MPLPVLIAMTETRWLGPARMPKMLHRAGFEVTLLAPNGANTVGGGINPLDLPGGAGCTSFDGGMAYDEVLWANPAAYYACAWDTGRAAVIQQPIKTLGMHSVPVHLHPEVESKVTVNVARSPEQAERQAKGEDLSIREVTSMDDLGLEVGRALAEAGPNASFEQ